MVSCELAYPGVETRLPMSDFLGEVVQLSIQPNGKPYHFEVTNSHQPFAEIATTQAHRQDIQTRVASPAYKEIRKLLSGEITEKLEVENRQINSSILITTESGLVDCIVKTNNRGERTGLDLLGGGPKHQQDYKLGPMGAVEVLGEEAITVFNDQILVPEEDADETIQAILENVADYKKYGGVIPPSHARALDLLSEGRMGVIKQIPYGFHPTIAPIIEAALPSVDITTKAPNGEVVDTISGKIDFHTEGSDFMRGFCIPDSAVLLDTENFFNPDMGRRQNTNRDIAFLTLEQIAKAGRGEPIYNVPISHLGELQTENLFLKPRAHMQEFSDRIAPFVS